MCSEGLYAQIYGRIKMLDLQTRIIQQFQNKTNGDFKPYIVTQEKTHHKHVCLEKNKIEE